MPFTMLHTSNGCMQNGVAHLMNQYTSLTPEQKIERYWDNVNKDGSIPAHMPHLGKCWEWTGGCIPDGYGAKRWNGQNDLAHRVSWIISNGSIPDSLLVLHKCDNRKCVRPDHLFLGTKKDNSDDMIAKGRKVNPEQRGEKNPFCKLTDIQVNEIRLRYKRRIVLQRELAREYGVSRAVISLIINNKRRSL